MKNYFISLEYWNGKRGFNRYAFTVIYADLEKEQIGDIAKNLISECEPDEDIDQVEFKVVAFNNVN